jgi:hypothetical protein
VTLVLPVTCVQLEPSDLGGQQASVVVKMTCCDMDRDLHWYRRNGTAADWSLGSALSLLITALSLFKTSVTVQKLHVATWSAPDLQWL